MEYFWIIIFIDENYVHYPIEFTKGDDKEETINKEEITDKDTKKNPNEEKDEDNNISEEANLKDDIKSLEKEIEEEKESSQNLQSLESNNKENTDKEDVNDLSESKKMDVDEEDCQKEEGATIFKWTIKRVEVENEEPDIKSEDGKLS